MPKLYISDVITRLSFPLRHSSFPALLAQTTTGLIARRGLPRRPLLCAVIALAPLVIGPVANAQPIAGKPPIVLATDDRFATFVAEAAQRFGIPATWIYVVIRAESSGQVRAVSPKGAGA